MGWCWTSLSTVSPGGRLGASRGFDDHDAVIHHPCRARADRQFGRRRVEPQCFPGCQSAEGECPVHGWSSSCSGPWEGDGCSGFRHEQQQSPYATECGNSHRLSRLFRSITVPPHSFADGWLPFGPQLLTAAVARKSGFDRPLQSGDFLPGKVTVEDLMLEFGPAQLDVESAGGPKAFPWTQRRRPASAKDRRSRPADGIVSATGAKWAPRWAQWWQACISARWFVIRQSRPQVTVPRS